MKNLLTITAIIMACFATEYTNAQTRQNRSLSGFDEVSISVEAKTIITQGNNYSVILEGDEDLLEDIITKVDGGELEIKKKSGNRTDLDEVVIYITSPVFKEINLAGSGSVIAESAIKSEKMELSLAGSGDIQIMDLTSNDVEISLAGSGNVKLAGSKTVYETEISIAGSGDVDASGLQTEELEVSISGSGNCIMGVSKHIEASIVGSGDVKYSGNPTVESSIIGSGRVTVF